MNPPTIQLPLLLSTTHLFHPSLCLNPLLLPLFPSTKLTWLSSSSRLLPLQSPIAPSFSPTFRSLSPSFISAAQKPVKWKPWRLKAQVLTPRQINTWTFPVKNTFIFIRLNANGKTWSRGRLGMFEGQGRVKKGGAPTVCSWTPGQRKSWYIDSELEGLHHVLSTGRTLRRAIYLILLNESEAVLLLCVHLWATNRSRVFF